MNKDILMIMDSLANPEKYTVEQVIANCYDTADAADAEALHNNNNVNDVYAAATAANYVHTYYSAANSAAYDYVDTAANAADNADCWLNRYFKYSGENKQDYIDEINKGYKHE